VIFVMKIHLIAGARPNFMKIAPLWHQMTAVEGLSPVLVHTGQHYSENMSDSIFRDLALPPPAYNLGVGGGRHGEQTGKTMVAYERVCDEDKPDAVLVVGDVNSTLAAALVAKKLNRNVIHLEAGLRSFDRSMPEEINRVATDAISDLLLTPSIDADANLEKEGVDRSRIIRVGNIMIDSLEMLRNRIEHTRVWEKLGLHDKEYVVVTMHRPSNVDDPNRLEKLVAVLERLSQQQKVCFPLHPRTHLALKRAQLLPRLDSAGVLTLEPMSYIEFMSLMMSSMYMLTDSGGIQEEASYVGIPCFTLRDNTERPITITEGTNQLVTIDSVFDEVAKCGSVLRMRRAANIDMWDGRTAGRVISAISKFF